jgi:hypothetical protein
MNIQLTGTKTFIWEEKKKGMTRKIISLFHLYGHKVIVKMLILDKEGEYIRTLYNIFLETGRDVYRLV